MLLKRPHLTFPSVQKKKTVQQSLLKLVTSTSYLFLCRTKKLQIQYVLSFHSSAAVCGPVKAAIFHVDKPYQEFKISTLLQNILNYSLHISILCLILHFLSILGTLFFGCWKVCLIVLLVSLPGHFLLFINIMLVFCCMC